ncbi:MAG: PHP domain-containing protein [Chloroflexi bacterium]|nr:PHP domain-containing protein [Chloroflexota bacterium]
MEVDLHTHTRVSDGVLEPEELVALAVEKGVRYLGITDHDATNGLSRAMKKAQEYDSLTIIPGVELSTDVPNGEVHLLGYLMDYHDPGFQSTLGQFRNAREGRGRKMVEKLCAMGLDIEWDRVLEIAGDGAIGRPHIAQALVEKGHIASVKEAFNKYIGRQGPAYVERSRLTPVEAVKLLAEVNGLPVLAHPGDIQDIDALLGDMKDAGLVGMEVYYDHYPEEMVNYLAGCARRFDLIPCGGSDYHGEGLGAQTDLGSVDVPLDSVLKLLALDKERKGKAARS